METTIMKVLNPLASLTGLLSIALAGCSGEHFPTANPPFRERSSRLRRLRSRGGSSTGRHRSTSERR